ncbi:MAG TPA: helix-turn-helix domain-containing protein [Bacteroidales bacterium]|jgi:transposase-like protein|nr:transposase [Chitinophagales bacterium]HOT55060.1 helix-turn-helix domain-containing protein [Bacteroidales bacterium]
MEKQKRKSANFKTNVVMELLRGETIEALSRKHGLTMAELSEWRDAFIANGMDGFKKKPEEAKLARAERRIGQLEMELDLVKKKNEFIAKQRKS